MIHNKPIICIIYYLNNKYEIIDLENHIDFFVFRCNSLFNIDKNDIIAKFEEETLFDMLEKIYDVIYTNKFYRYIPNLKINLYINPQVKGKFYDIKVKEDILNFKQKYDKIAMLNLGQDSMYYILQSLYKLCIINDYKSLNNLELLLNKDCKIKFLDLEYYDNISIVNKFLENNETLEYLHISITNSVNINLLCEGLLKNDYLTNLDLRFSRFLTYNDFIRIINSSNSIINFNFSNIILLNIANFDLLLNALIYNTSINSLHLIETKPLNYEADDIHNLYFPLDNKIINLLRNNKTIHFLNIFNDIIKKYFNSFDESILEGLKYNNTLIEINF